MPRAQVFPLDRISTTSPVTARCNCCGLEKDSRKIRFVRVKWSENFQYVCKRCIKKGRVPSNPLIEPEDLRKQVSKWTGSRNNL